MGDVVESNGPWRLFSQACGQVKGSLAWSRRSPTQLESRTWSGGGIVWSFQVPLGRSSNPVARSADRGHIKSLASWPTSSFLPLPAHTTTPDLTDPRMQGARIMLGATPYIIAASPGSRQGLQHAAGERV